MIEHLGILADFNNQTFPDHVFPYTFRSDRINKVSEKPKKDRTAAEQKLIETMNYYLRAGLSAVPIGHFVHDNTVEKSFRYLGKGIRLGDKNRVVCWYKLKGASSYRVIYGDLSFNDLPPEALPLPVDT